MAKLVKIKNVYLYTGLTAGAADCVEALKLLRDSGIKFTSLNYSDQDKQHEENFKALSTWTFGEGETSYKKEFSDYPIVVWDECFDDWSIVKHASHGLQELKESSLLANKEAADQAE